jgi:hypothetical protein
MEVLNHLLHWVEQRGLLTAIPGVVGSRVSLYANDLVLFLTPTEPDLQAIRATMTIFGLASGLFANLDKSVTTPLNCSELDLARVQEVLACAVENFPCRYLGVPLSVFHLRHADEQPLLNKVAARIPEWKGQLLNAAGRSALIKATLSTIPIHTAITLCLSP